MPVSGARPGSRSRITNRISPSSTLIIRIVPAGPVPMAALRRERAADAMSGTRVSCGPPKPRWSEADTRASSCPPARADGQANVLLARHRPKRWRQAWWRPSGSPRPLAPEPVPPQRSPSSFHPCIPAPRLLGIAPALMRSTTVPTHPRSTAQLVAQCSVTSVAPVLCRVDRKALPTVCDRGRTCALTPPTGAAVCGHDRPGRCSLRAYDRFGPAPTRSSSWSLAPKLLTEPASSPGCGSGVDAGVGVRGVFGVGLDINPHINPQPSTLLQVVAQLAPARLPRQT